MSLRAKIQLVIFVFLGCLFLAIAAFQWYDLHQIELGLRTGNLSMILLKVYEMAGKWGVALVYIPFAGYSFWRAYSIFSISKNEEVEEDDNSEM